MADKIKLGIASLLIIAGFIGFYYLSGNITIVRLLPIFVGIVVAAVIGYQTVPGKQLFVFGQEAIAETKKVVWPTRKETIQTTAVVFIFVIVMAIFLGLIDAGLLAAVKKLMGQVD